MIIDHKLGDKSTIKVIPMIIQGMVSKVDNIVGSGWSSSERAFASSVSSHWGLAADSGIDFGSACFCAP